MFSAHGKWEIEINGQVVIQRMPHSWNEEGMLAYIENFREAVTPFLGKNWATLSVFEDWKLGHPDMDKHVVKH